MLIAAAGCDQGGPADQAHGVGAPVHFTANIGPDQPLAVNASIELTFDRLLLPQCIVRQTFQLSELTTTLTWNVMTPEIAYDPVSRVVTITALPDSPLVAGQTYRLIIFTPPQPDNAGLAAIDGATLDPPTSVTITFLAAPAGPPPTPAPTIDFCSDINPIFQAKCGGSGCHGAPPEYEPAEGLALTAPWGVTATAIGKVALESNTGPQPAASSPGPIFDVDMPIVDPGPGGGAAGDPANSFMIYKLLMAVPAPGDAGDIEPLSSAERATLASLIPGREMPFPADPGAPLTQVGAQLTLDQLEMVSQWIAQGASVPSSCP